MLKQKINKEHKNLKLSIQVSLNGLSFCGLETTNQEIVFFENNLFKKKENPAELLREIKRVFADKEFLNSEFEEVTVLFSNELYSLVPKAFFREDQASNYLKFNAKILENDFVAHDFLDRQDLVNVHIPYANINNFFFDVFGEFEYRHCVSVLVDSFLKEAEPQNNEAEVFLNNHPWGYDLVIVKQGKLLFCNSFPCDTKEDFIYYLLFTAEQLDLDPNNFQLTLLGHIAKASDYYKIAYTYIKNIRFLDTSFGFQFEAQGMPPRGYQYYPLFKVLQ